MMNYIKIHESYLQYLYDIIYDKKIIKDRKYSELLSYLLDTDFTYILDMDSNRALDGLELRESFAIEHNIPIFYIDRYLNTNCSILEMLIALAMRCENMLWEVSKGDRTAKWFWTMISNLGLWQSTNDKFSIEKVETIINNLLNRTYSSDGTGGGLFILDNPISDLRDEEIWTQLNWWINEQFPIKF